MSRFTATIRWQRGAQVFTDNHYSRAHEWEFDGGQVIPASASPHIVPEPMSVAANVDPEEAFVASLSSCHMLFFLSLAMERGLIVDDYVDQAHGIMRRNDDGRMAVGEVTLHPQATYSGRVPSRTVVEELHAEAHHRCFIASSVRSEIRIEIVS